MKRKKRRSKGQKIQVFSYKFLNCSECGRPVEVASDAIGVKCAHCVVRMVPWETKKTPTGPKKPRGWHFRSEFVDSEGNVYFRGVLQPVLKGTRSPSKITKSKKKKKKRRTVNVIKDELFEKELTKISKKRKRRTV